MTQEVGLEALWGSQRRPWYRSISAKLLAALVPPTLAVLIVVPSAYSATDASQRAEEQVRRSEQVRTSIYDLRATLFEAASRLRGYLLTDLESFFSDFTEVRDRIEPATDDLAALVADDPVQVRHMAAVSDVEMRLLRTFEATLQEHEARRHFDPELVRLSVETNEELDDLAGTLVQMDAVEARALAGRLRIAEEADRRLRVAIALALPASLALSLALFTVVAARATKRLRRLEASALRLAREQPLDPLPKSGDEIGSLAISIERASQTLAERRAIEHEQTRRLRDLYENAPFGYHSLDADARFVQINETELRWLGYTRDEVVDVRTIFDVVSAASAEVVRRQFPVFKETGAVANLELEMVRRDGTRFPALLSATAVRDEHGDFVMSRSTVIDITERKRAEEAALRQAWLLDRVADAVVSADPELRITGWNNGAQLVYQWSAQEVIGKVFHEVVPSAMDDESIQEIIAALARDGHWSGETTHYRRDGTPVAIEASTIADRDHEGNIVGFVSVNRDVTARREADELRRRAEEEVRAANEAKTEFLSHMSHELRTPLNVILGFGQLLEMEQMPPGQLESVQRIVSAGRHLLDLISEVLDISRIESGTMTLSTEPLRVLDALDEAVELMAPLAAARNIRISTERAEMEALHVRADRQRMKQVLLNLLSNAVKYNREGGSIRVRAEVTDDTCRIHVSDTGPGIEADDLERIFRPFERLPEVDPAIEGTGLGLALSRSLMEAMGGTLTGRSAEGAGSTFTLELPVTSEPVTPPQPDVARVRAHPPDGHTLLYVEDNLSNLRLVERLLEQRPGVSLLSAMQGSIGLELARQHRPDLVLLDLHLPDMDGRQVLRELRGDPRTKDVAVLVVTADATDESHKELMDAGATGFLTKPLNLERFLAAIDEALDEGRRTDA